MRVDLLDGVLAFTRVAEKRSFTEAARELGVTTAAVSWTVKQLEARVGAPLLTRTTRSVGMTEAGALFLEHARAGVAQVAAGFQVAQSFGARPTGLLRLNLPTVAQPLLEPILADFSAAYPDIELELAIEDRFIDIVAGGYDAGIRIGEMIAQDMVAVRLTKPSALTVVGSPSYFARRGKPEHPEQLMEHACINIRQTSGGIYRWAFEEEFENGKSREFEIAAKGPLIVNAPALALSAAISGVGLTYTVAASIEPLVEQGVLQPCLEPYMPTMPGFFIYFPSQAQVLPKLRAFLDFWSRVRARRA
jgi:DNA-binding transcriptional LysR family regulator